jgi:hypothetical protein
MPVHAVPPWALVQALPQLAQFAVVPRAVSQPAAAVQSANPAPQPVCVQVPVAHDAAPFGNEQACPQFTQFVLVLTGVSQPSSGFPLQFLKPASQVGAQSNEPGAPEQALPPCSFVQALPQLAQFEFVPSCVSHPLAELQSAKPESHPPIVQVPAPHDALACENEQGTSQSPQLVRVRMSRSQPLSATASQLLNPAAHTGTQPVAGLQLVVPWALVHASLHERQCAASPSGVSQFGAPATHSAKPVAHVVAVHVPVAHDSFEFGMSHVTPHTLQSVSVRVDVSQPFAVLLSQLPKPTSHVGVQTPLAQGFVPCAFEQALPQAAQFAVVPSGVSQPFVARESQLPKPAVHVPSAHVPVAHDSAAFCRSQSTSQSPQSVSVRMLRSQPLRALPSQLRKPASQAGMHPVVALHVVVPWAFVHESPHERQSVMVPSWVSQPACVAEQSL